MSLASELVEERDELITCLKDDYNSTSRFFGYKPYTYEATHRIQDCLLFGHTHFYKTDFSNFYGSFYTHPIPWLIHGKEKAKKHPSNDEFVGNRLDKLLRSEQDGETHGVPTGTLTTRIIMEICMSHFDEKLRRMLEEHDETKYVTFYRYVDDFYFGYDQESELVVIKDCLNILTSRYGITLNEEKTREISLNEIKKESKLVYYFSNLDSKLIIDKSTPFLINKELKAYYTMANEEIARGVKGADKLIYTSLEFYINTLSNDKSIGNFLQGMIYVDKNCEVCQNSFIDSLIQLVFEDSKRTIKFLQLLDAIQQKEEKIGNSIVTDHLRNRLTDSKVKKLLFHRLKIHLKHNENQEFYFILLLYRVLDIHMPVDDIKIIFNVWINDSDINLDDFSAVLLMGDFILGLESSEEKDCIKIIEMLHKKLATTGVSYFAKDHWLLKYEILSFSNKYDNFKNLIIKFYEKENISKSSQFFLQESFKIINNKPDVKKSERRQVEVNKFYIKLLSENIDFTMIPQKDDNKGHTKDN